MIQFIRIESPQGLKDPLFLEQMKEMSKDLPSEIPAQAFLGMSVQSGPTHSPEKPCL
jgi:hypothetical protein